MPIFEYNNTKINVPEDKIEAFKKNFPTATLFEEKEKEVEITPDVRPPSIEKPDEMMPDMDSLPGKPMGEASSVPRDDFAIDPFDTSDSVGPKMDTDLKSAFDKTPLGEARLSTIDKVANSPDYSIGVEQQAYNRLTGQSDRPMQMLGQTEDAIAKASRQEYENYKHQKEGTRIFKEGLVPKIKDLQERIKTESAETYTAEKAQLDSLKADKPFYLKALEGLAEGDPNKAVHDPFKGMEGVKTYNAASYFLDDANRIIKEAEKSQSGTNVNSALRAFVDKGFSVETWNFGVNEFDRNGSILKAVEKSERGQTLTKDEDALLDALALNLAVNDYYGSDIKRGYKWGEIAGESLPFMLEFMLNPIAGGAQGMARRVAIHAIKKMGVKGAGRTAVKVVTHLGSDIVAGAAMAATTGVFKTAADGLNRMIGEPLYDIKEDGSIVYGGRVGGEDAVTAFMKAYGANTIEYGSEMFGNNMMWNIMGKTKVAKGLRKQFKATGLGKVAGRMHASKAVKGLSKLEARAQWAGPIGELVEEWYGTILNATFIGDQEYKDVLDMDENLDMLAGFLITQGPMSAAKSFGYGIDRAQSNRDLKRFSSENSNHFDNWEGLKNQLADLPLLERIAIQKQMFARDDISIGAKESFGKYVAALTYNDALTGAAEGRKEVDLTAATANGQKLANEIQDKRSIVLKSLNNEIESYRAILGDRFDMSEQELADDPQLSTDAEMQAEMIEAARKHDIAYAEYESVLNGLVTQAEEFIKPQLESIAQATRKDGTVIKSSILGEDVFVMKGDIAFNADGSMDKKNSSEYLVVKNENGDKSQVPLRHLTYAEQMTAEQMTAEVKRQAKEKFVDPFIAKMEGVTKFELGEEVSFLNDKGETIVGRVGAKTQDGVVSISTNDGKILSFTEQDLASRQVTQSAGAFNVQDNMQIDIDGEAYDAQIIKIEDGQISLFIPGAPTAEGRYITVGEAELNSMLYNEAEVEEEAKKKLEEEEEEYVESASDKHWLDKDRDFGEYGNTRREFIESAHKKGAKVTFEDGGYRLYMDNQSWEILEPMYNYFNSLDNPLQEAQAEKKTTEEVTESVPQTRRQVGDEVHTFEGDKLVKIEKRNSDGSLTQTWAAEETVETKEEVKSEVEETEEETEDKFPRKKDGKVDFESIKEPATYKEALESEFGKEMAKEIVAEELDDAKKAYQAALKSKKGSAADRAYAKRDALARVKRFEEMMTPIKEQSSKEGTYEGDNINKPSQAIQDNWNDTQKEVGNDDTIRLQDGSVIEGTWVLVEADSLTPSHNSETLETNEGYPVTDNGENVNDRTYHDKRGELEHEARKGFDERAIQDPIVVQQGAVMSGNKRTIIGQMSARLGTYGGYLEVLPSKMKEKGIAEGAEKNYKNPMLVFERKGETPFTTEEMSRFNLQEKQAKSYTEIAIAQSKKKSEETLKGVRKIARVIDRYADMKSLYSSSEGGIELFNLMVEHGMLTRAEKNAIIDSEGKLTSNGQDFLESIVLGSVLEANTIQSLSLEGMKAHRNKITKSLTSLLKNQGQAFEVAPYIDAAVQYIHEARNKKSGVMGMFTFAGLFEDIPLHEKYDYAAATLAIVLEKKGDVFSKEMAHLADYFDPMSAKDAFHVGTKEGYLQSIIEYLPKDDKDAIETLRKGAESAREARDIADTKGEKVGQGEGAGVNEGKSDNKTGSDGSSDGGVSSTVEKSDPKFRATRRTVSYMAEIANLEKEFGVKATVHTSTETIGNTKARNQIEADIKGDIPMANRAKGWMVDGEVHIYLPHAESIADIYKTYIHEAIGHKGVREFLGAEKHDALMETIYGYLPTDFKDRSLAQLKEIHPEKTDLELKRLVADEFVAVLSEDAGLKVEHKNIWEKIVEAVMKALGKDKTFFQFGEAEKIALEVIGQAAQSMREEKQTETSKGDNVLFRKGALETQLLEAQKTQKEAQKRYNQAQNKHAKLSTQAAKDVLYGNKGQTDLFGAPPVGSDNLFQNEESINTGVRDILDDARKEKEEAAREVNRAAKAVEVIKEKIFNEQIGQQSLFDGEDVRFRMLGKEGAMRLDKLEDSTRRLNNLSVAKKMAADNVDAKKIKKATGWETAKDGKWRYETSDMTLSEAAQREIMDIIKDIDHAKDYYERLAKDHNVLRTEEAPRFRKGSPEQKIENIKERTVNSDIDASTVLIGNETLLDLIIRETDNENLASDIFNDVYRAVRDYNSLEKAYPLNRRGKRPGEVDYDKKKSEITETLNNTIIDIKDDPAKNRYARERINVINEVIKNADKINDFNDDIAGLVRFRKTNTPEFKSWFGDSKVVDAKGQPLVVYHGTDKAFTEFDSDKTMDGLFWFTSDRNAIDQGEVGAAGRGEVIEAYLKAENLAGWEQYEKLGMGQIMERGYDGVKLDDTYIVFEPNQIKSATDNLGTFDAANPDIRFRKITDQSLIDKLESGEKIKVYRAMQLIDGKLYPPMSAKIGKELRTPIELGQWEQAEERPDLINDKGKFKLDKAEGKGTLNVAYNPYIHTSRSPLNDQFKGAYDRPNLVTVEVEVPASELDSGYRAEGAKDAVGEMPWNAGVVSRQLPEGKKRQVILSRYDKPLRIVPDIEVAKMIAEQLKGTNISIPENVVTPSLLTELEKLNVPIAPHEKGVRKNHNWRYNEPRFRKVEPFKYGEGGTKGIFKGEDGTLYKSLQPGVPVWKDGQGTREYLDTETQEYDILKRLDGDKRFPIIGEKVQTSEGPAFEIEPLVEVKNLTLKEYEAVEATIQELNDKGIFHNDFISVMRRDNTNEVVINDFSSGNYDPSRAKDSYWKDSLFSRLEDLLSKEDLAELKEKRAQKRLEEYQKMFPDEDLTIDDVRYRRGNMAALHNIGEEHLMDALNGKGLIAPSIGVTNVENEYSDFGAITLIAPKKMVDPTRERVKVFAGDAYTPTVPRPMYHVNEKALDNWGRQVTNKAMKISRDIANLIASEVHDYGSFYKDLFKYNQKSVVSEYENNMDMKLAYLVDSDIRFTVPMKEKQAYLGMNFYFDMTDAERKRGKYIYDKYNKETEASNSDVSEQTIQDYQSYIYGIISDRITEKYKNLDKEGREYLVPRMIDRLYSNYKDAINMGLHNLSPAFTRTRVVDMKALEKRVNNKIVKRDYRAWLNNKVDEFQGTRYFIDGKEKRGYYAENILDYITRYTRGQEKTLTYGMNKAKSYGIKELNSIPAMQELRDILIPKEEMSKIDEAYSNEYMDLSSKVDYLDGDTWDGLNALGKALTDHYKGMSPARALSKNGFDSKKGSEYFRDFAKRLKENPVDYFEAKMQRMVPISEFAAVAVPLGTSTETTKKLREAGLKVVKYDPTVEGDRQAKVAKASDKSDIRFRRGNADNLMDNADNFKDNVKDYNAFLNNALNNTTNKQALIDKARSEGLSSLPKVIEQYLAEIDNPAELEAIKNELRVDMPDEAMRYLLWRNANPNDGSVAWRAKESMKMQELDPNVLFRRGSIPLPNAFNEYERRVRSRYNKGFKAQMFRIEEGWFDKMTSLRILQEAIAGKDIPGNQNAYQLENQLSSKNAAEIERYNKRVIEPMLQAVHKVFGNSLTDADLYLMAKHGLERNDKMAYYYAHEAFKGQKENLKAMLDSGEIGPDGYNLGMQNINSQARQLYEQYKENDYSGLTEVANQRGLGESFQEAGQNIVAEVEGRASQEDINELWARVNEANKIILKKQFDSGKMSQGEYEQIKGMYDFYVPLRGFDAKVATDYYSYLENKPSEFSSVLKKAWGRKSKADSPIATMMNMSESGFMEANRNVMKQAFLQLVQQNKSDLASVRDFWYVKDAEGNWTETFPEIPEGAMGQEVIDILDAFDARMEALGEDASRGRNNLDVGVKILPAQASEHAVRVWMGGKESIVYVNGNPRAAQAINGLIGKNHQEDGKTIMNGLRHLGRMMASNFTSNNPTFVVTNLLRDVQFAVAAGAIKEGGRYSANLALNLAKTPKTVAQNLWGQGNEANSEYQQYWDEFLMGGGETGYTQINTMDKHRKFVNSKLREFDNKVDVLSLFRGYVKQMETANRLIESNTRFATFVTSRQAGRDVQRSVADAKEITINFNRKGSGGVGASIAHNFYLFSNPAIQSARMMGLMAKNQPKAFFGALAASMSGGFLTPIMNELLLELVGDDDDKEKYWNINPWVRRNNLVLYLPWTESKFLTIPLPHELRAFHGIGEMSYAKMTGRMRHENMAKEVIGQFSNMLPMDMAGEHDWFVPDFLKPIEQAFWSNKNFMNRPIYKKTPWNERDPEWTKAYKNTPEMLIDFSKWTNERSGGDDVKKGKADVKLNNPAVLNTLAQGYFGGALTMYTDIADLAYKLLTKEEVSVRDVPFVNKVVRESGSDVRNQNNYSEYSIYKEWYKDFKHDFDGYNKLRRDNPLYQNKYREMKAMPEYKTFKLMERRIKAIDKLRDKNPERYEQKLEEFIKEMHMIEDGY